MGVVTWPSSHSWLETLQLDCGPLNSTMNSKHCSEKVTNLATWTTSSNFVNHISIGHQRASKAPAIRCQYPIPQLAFGRTLWRTKFHSLTMTFDSEHLVPGHMAQYQKGHY